MKIAHFSQDYVDNMQQDSLRGASSAPDPESGGSRQAREKARNGLPLVKQVVDIGAGNISI